MKLKGIDGIRKRTFEVGSFNMTPEEPPMGFQCDIPIYFASNPDFSKRLWFDKQMDLTPLLKKQNISDVLKPWHSQYDKDDEHPTDAVENLKKVVAKEETKDYVLSKIDCDWTTSHMELYMGHLFAIHNVDLESITGNSGGSRSNGGLASIGIGGGGGANIRIKPNTELPPLKMSTHPSKEEVSLKNGQWTI